MTHLDSDSDVPPLPIDSVMRLALRSDSLLFSLAQTTDELTQAYQLVYRNYLRSEYTDPHPSQMRYSVFNILPETITLVARLNSAIVTTASVVFDSPLGLPLETIYSQEVDQLRREGCRVCEVVMLSDRRRAGMRTIPAILQLFKLVFHYTLTHHQTTDVLITVNPSHEAFYTRWLPFEDLGPLRYYPSVKNAPALAKRANLVRVLETYRARRLGSFFIDDPPPQEIFSVHKRFTEEELRSFFVLQRDILPKLPSHLLDFVKSKYPDCDFSRILAPRPT